MRLQSITNEQSGQKPAFKSVYRVGTDYASIPCASTINPYDNSATNELYKLLSADNGKNVTYIGAPTIYQSDLVLLDDKYGKEASAYKALDASFTNKLSDKQVAINKLRMQVMYEKFSKKAFVINTNLFNKLNEIFDSIKIGISKLKR